MSKNSFPHSMHSQDFLFKMSGQFLYPHIFKVHKGAYRKHSIYIEFFHILPAIEGKMIEDTLYTGIVFYFHVGFVYAEVNSFRWSNSWLYLSQRHSSWSRSTWRRKFQFPAKAFSYFLCIYKADGFHEIEPSIY